MEDKSLQLYFGWNKQSFLWEMLKFPPDFSCSAPLRLSTPVPTDGIVSYSPPRPTLISHLLNPPFRTAHWLLPQPG